MIRRTALSAALALTGALCLGACSSDSGSDKAKVSSENSQIKISGAFVPKPVNNKMAGGFLTVTNQAHEADTLLAATSDLSDDVQLHETVDNKMRQVESFDVPANGTLKLARGGNHLMFMELKRSLSVGDTVEVTLEFENADPVTVEMPVKPATHNPRGSGGSDHGHDHNDHDRDRDYDYDDDRDRDRDRDYDDDRDDDDNDGNSRRRH